MARPSSYTSTIIDQALDVEQRLSGIDVVYRRGAGGDSQALTVVPGEEAAEQEVDDGGTIATAFASVDWLFKLADIAETFTRPAAGDRIEVPDAEGTPAVEVYELVPMDDRAHFSYRDAGRKWVRVRTVKLSEV